MAEHRMFVSQATLDQWLGDDAVDVDGDVMAIRRLGHRFQLNTAFHFLSEVAEGGDSSELVGKVKTLDQVVALGGEHCAGSVILGDNAYEVVEGFLGLPIPNDDAGSASLGGANLAAATRAAAGDGNPPSQELDLLAQFFLSSKG
ncbi:MAG: hypothetical protein IPG17_31170 [Sandaracinaceae bacterium]|jgi:hypothetical protein|nr:hypothetical protein [Sandaracinaceae bacterium]MBP7680399.1 hypothetical protein [Deltaproteobacteria bacterium]MBK6811314.1 hypothetical protein [Sandaracinaceae bacterium]MBK7151111.1 hypothetical protein [Sandaracinaceae bacterium]MBK7776618.1 hypothetical protein [Sandaracinaceae bacterium]